MYHNQGEIKEMLSPKTVKVGDGVTTCGYSDCESFTVVAVTPCGITIQRDKANLLTKPEIIPGGFMGYCTNNRELKYDITPDPKGYKERARWSNKKGRYITSGGKRVSEGRYEFYDYSF
jgi:hypothetical protein